MEKTASEIPFLKNIGLFITFKCQVACPHCIVQAGPGRMEAMTLETIDSHISQIASYRQGHIRMIAITGGEPFVDIDRLRHVVAMAAQRHLLVSVVTNAFWAETPGRANAVIESIPGLSLIAISTDRYHQESIPFERVKNAIQAAESCGVPYDVSLCTENEDDPEHQRILAQVRSVAEKDAIHTAITFPVGRALEKLGTAKYTKSSLPPISACSFSNSPMIFPDGRVLACIGPVLDIPTAHPLVLGNLNESTLEAILDKAELNPILHTLRVWGPRKIVELVAASQLKGMLPKSYIADSICQACYSLINTPAIAEYLQNLAQDEAYAQRVAYARVFYLKEPLMAQCLGLTNNPGVPDTGGLNLGIR
jgi:MoaA/NifB/PqqE/SkfB family radical SAM enzyme